MCRGSGVAPRLDSQTIAIAAFECPFSVCFRQSATGQLPKTHLVDPQGDLYPHMELDHTFGWNRPSALDLAGSIL
ncbi:MAG: hypothetical protein JWN03_8444 [Nocardia sp.]|nr:hypothetical protein [Nocardia sp.]